MQKRRVRIVLEAEIFAEADESLEELVESAFALPIPHLLSCELEEVQEVPVINSSLTAHHSPLA